jgi:ribonuclease-3
MSQYFLSLLSIFRKGRKTNTYQSLYQKLSYHFVNEDLVKQALTHRSLTRGHVKKTKTNERLEFLGDAVLGMVVTDALFHQFPQATEGELTKAKSVIVSRDKLAKQARKINLGDYLYLGKGEEQSGGRNRDSNLANAFEALLGAMYLDGGLEVIQSYIRNHLLDDIEKLLTTKFHNNYKSWLLEYIQSQGKPYPEYDLLEVEGPDHQKKFTVSVRVNRDILGKGTGASKKRAEQAAARNAIYKLGLIKDG